MHCFKKWFQPVLLNIIVKYFFANNNDIKKPRDTQRYSKPLAYTVQLKLLLGQKNHS